MVVLGTYLGQLCQASMIELFCEKINGLIISRYLFPPKKLHPRCLKGS